MTNNNERSHSLNFARNLTRIRADFPALTQRVRNKPWVYLDSAATALKPWPVIEALGHFYTYGASNVHRGAHYVADQATVRFEKTRELTAVFLNAQQTQEIIFTKGTTESINLVANAWGDTNINSGDEILISEMEHHANIVPWQMLCQRKNAKLVVAKITDQGLLDWDDFAAKITQKTKLVALTQCSNVLGTIVDVKKAAQLAHAKGAKILVDGAQYVTFAKVDVQDLDVDFYVFSAHKLFGPFGVGILYGKKQWLDAMPPYQGGGSMISSVSFEKTEYNDVPFRFEAGTPNIAGVIGLGAAIEYLNKIGMEAVNEHEIKMAHEVQQALQDLGGIRIFGNASTDVKAPIVSFHLEGAHPADVGQILDQESIAVRVGHLCAQPLMKRLGITGTIRASFSIYNETKDLEKLVEALKKAKEILL